MANFSAGFATGVITNPIDLVYNRQVADSLYPKELRRNYSTFYTGLVKANTEGALFRGAIASGISYGLLLASMSNFYDYCKEWMYWFFGPTNWLRPVCLAPTAFLGVYLYLPFDNIKVRLHTMTRLPDGRFPYTGVLDAFGKIFSYEANYKKYSNLHAFHAGAVGAFMKLYITLIIGCKVTDYSFENNYQEGELLQDGDFFRPPHVGHIPHDPINKASVNQSILDASPSKVYYIDDEKSGSFKI